MLKSLMFLRVSIHLCVLLIGGLVVFGCSIGDLPPREGELQEDGGSLCTAGETKTCYCTESTRGMMTCKSDGIFGSCVCKNDSSIPDSGQVSDVSGEDTELGDLGDVLPLDADEVDIVFESISLVINPVGPIYTGDQATVSWSARGAVECNYSGSFPRKIDDWSTNSVACGDKASCASGDSITVTFITAGKYHFKLKCTDAAEPLKSLTETVVLVVEPSPSLCGGPCPAGTRCNGRNLCVVEEGAACQNRCDCPSGSNCSGGTCKHVDFGPYAAMCCSDPYCSENSSCVTTSGEFDKCK